MIEDTCIEVRESMRTTEELSDECLARVARHVENCSACAEFERELDHQLLLQLIDSVPHTADEKRAVLELRAENLAMREPIVGFAPVVMVRNKWSFKAAVGAIAVVGSLFVLPWNGMDGQEPYECSKFQAGLREHRPILPRLSFRCADGYRSPDADRSGSGWLGDEIGHRERGVLEERGDWRGLIAAAALTSEPVTPYVRMIERDRQRLTPEVRDELAADLDSDLAALLLKRGREGDAQRALMVLERALQREPQHPQALFNRGIALWKLELYDPAGRAFERAARVSSDGWRKEASERAESARNKLHIKLDEWLRREDKVVDRKVQKAYQQTKEAIAAHDVKRAYSLAKSGWKLARQRRDWHFEILFLGKLKHLALISDDVSGTRTALGRAYLEERLARQELEYHKRFERDLLSPDDHRMICLERYYAHHAVAEMEINRKRFPVAESYMEEIERLAREECRDVPIQTTFNRVMNRVALLDGRESLEKVQDIRGELVTLRDKWAAESGLVPMIDHIEGSLMLDLEPETGARLLWRAIRKVDELRAQSPSGRATSDAEKARAYSYSKLALYESQRGDAKRALSVLAHERKLRPPTHCAIGAVEHLDRLFLAISADGRAVGARASAIERLHGRAEPVPSELTGALTGCDVVDVYAKAPYYGLPGLLDDELAWRFVRFERPEPPADAIAARQVIVHSVKSPADLGLPELDFRTRRDRELTQLTGLSATPKELLNEIRTATFVAIHAHGLHDDSDSGESYIALASEVGGDDYRLTPEHIRSQRLIGNPVVILGACHGSSVTSHHHGSSSLADAFLYAGARVVIASTAPIRNRSGNEIFEHMRTRIIAGEQPAVVVRDIRQAEGQNHPWVRQLLVFE